MESEHVVGEEVEGTKMTGGNKGGQCFLKWFSVLYYVSAPK
jgi:hypothetical protein